MDNFIKKFYNIFWNSSKMLSEYPLHKLLKIVIHSSEENVSNRNQTIKLMILQIIQVLIISFFWISQTRLHTFNKYFIMIVLSRAIVFSVTIILVMSLDCGPSSQSDKLQTGFKQLVWDPSSASNEKNLQKIQITTFPIEDTGNFEILTSIYEMENFQVLKNVDFEIHGMLDPILSRLFITVRKNSGTTWSRIKISYMASQNSEFLLGTAATYPQLGQNSAIISLNQTRFALKTQYKAFALLSGIKSSDSNFSVNVLTSEINPQTGRLVINFGYEGTRPEFVKFSYFVYEAVHDQFAYSTFGIGGTYQIKGFTSLQMTQNPVKSFALCRKSFESFCPENEINYEGQCICIDQTKRNPLNNYKCFSQCKLNQVFINGKCICDLGFALVGDECVACTQNQLYVESTQSCQCKAGFERFSGKCVPECLVNEIRGVNGKCQCRQQFYFKGNQCILKPPCPALSLFNVQLQECVCLNTNEHIINGVCQECQSNYFWDGNQCEVCADNCVKCTEKVSCTQCATGYVIGPSGLCIPACGDGRKLAVEQCDDGNLDNEDGCNSFCRIEQKWECSGGSIYSPSTCSKIKLKLMKTQNFLFPNRVQIYYGFSDFPSCFLSVVDPTTVAESIFSIEITNSYRFAVPYLYYDAFVEKYIADFVFDSAREGDVVRYRINYNVGSVNQEVQKCLSELDTEQIIQDQIVYSVVANPGRR